MTKKNKAIHVLIKHPNKKAEFIDIPNTLEAFQNAVDGYIEALTVCDHLVVVCDEEGVIKEKDYNTRVCGIDFFGTIVICGTKGEKFTSIPVDDKNTKRIFAKLFAEGDAPDGMDENHE